MKIKVCRYCFGSPNIIQSNYWIWYLVNNRNERIATSCQRYTSRKIAVRFAKYYATKFTFGIFELGVK